MRAWTAALIVFVEHMARTTSDKHIITEGLFKDCSRIIMVFKDQDLCNQSALFDPLLNTVLP